jgi:hypothetical protein
VTKKRQFGKLQKEWEERNKYVKAPANERERLEQESKWTPLQKKMAQYDKYQEVYNKIPPMWIKERADLKTKYTDFKKKMVKFWQDIQDIKKSNPNDDSVRRDMIDDVKKKIRQAADQLLLNVKDFTIETKLNQFVIELEMATTNVENVIEQSEFYKKAKGDEEKNINDRYVKPILDAADIEGKRKDLEILEKQEPDIRRRINPHDPYGNKSAQMELAKVQGEIRKKKAELETLEKKYGKGVDGKIDGSELIKTWEASQEQLKKLGETIENDKTIEEKKIKVESVNKELDKKLEEIVKLKKELMLAKFFAGQYDDLDKEKFESKASKDRPLENVETLQANLDLAKDQYLEIAAKFSDFNKLQAKITLLNSDLTDLKELKEAKKKGKDKKDKEKGEKNKDIGVIEKKASDAKIEKTASDIKQIEGYTKDIELIEKEIAEKYTPILEKTELKIKLYNAYIDFLKSKGQKEPNIIQLLKDKETEFSGENGLLKQLDELIKKRIELKMIPEEKSKVITKEIEEIQKNIKELEKDKAKNKEAIDNSIKSLENKKKELASITNDLDNKLRELNVEYEKKVELFKGSIQKGGRLLRRTRKHRNQKKPSKRYILSKHKIKKKKSKSSRYQKKKYTLRRWKR